MTTGHASKLLFIDGNEVMDIHIADQLTEEAMNLCKLLAINPEDLATR